jgi:hypothetical protein
VRLELTTPALLLRTVYKYRALTDCATGDKGERQKEFAMEVFDTFPNLKMLLIKSVFFKRQPYFLEIFLN